MKCQRNEVEQRTELDVEAEAEAEAEAEVEYGQVKLLASADWNNKRWLYVRQCP